jgi:hypothetical protein
MEFVRQDVRGMGHGPPMVTACWPGGGGCGLAGGPLVWWKLQPVNEISQQGSPLATDCDHSTRLRPRQARSCWTGRLWSDGGVPHDGRPVLVRSDLANGYSIVCRIQEVVQAVRDVFAEVPT